MPELPEVETVREGVQTHAASLVIERVRILDARSTRRHVPGTADFAARLEGTRIHRVYRRGKYMWLTLAATGRGGCASGEHTAVCAGHTPGNERAAAGKNPRFCTREAPQNRP